MKRKICLFTVLALITVSFAACGNKSEKEVNITEKDINKSEKEINGNENKVNDDEKYINNNTEPEYEDSDEKHDGTEEKESQEIKLPSFEDTRDWESTIDSSVSISYEITDNTEEVYEFSAPTGHIGNSEAEGPVYLIAFDEAVTDFSLWALNANVNDSGELLIDENEKLDYIDEVPAKNGVYVYPGDVGETLPFKGISIVDTNGQVHHFYLGISGMDGSAVVNEYVFS